MQEKNTPIYRAPQQLRRTELPNHEYICVRYLL